MIEIFIALVVGLLLGAIWHKYGDNIIDIILFPILVVVCLILAILSIPERIILLFTSNDKLERRILREYDRIFFEAESMSGIERISSKIAKLEFLLKKNIIKKRDKETIKWLNKSKWLI